MPVSDASILKSTLAWGCGSSTWSLLAVSRRDQPLQLCRLHVEAGPTASPVRCPLCLSKAVIYSTPPERPVVADSVEKVALAAACRSGVPAVEVAASHFKLPFGVSLSVLAQV